MTHIDDLIRRLRRMSPQLDMMQCEDVLQAADALEDKAARVKQQDARIADLEAQLAAFREAAKPISSFLPTLSEFLAGCSAGALAMLWALYDYGWPK